MTIRLKLDSFKTESWYNESCNTCCNKLFLITFLAIACIALGSGIYGSNIYPPIGGYVGLALLSLGILGIVGIAVHIVCFEKKRTIASYENGEKYKSRLNPGEFFIYTDQGGRNCYHICPLGDEDTGINKISWHELEVRYTYICPTELERRQP